MWNLIALGMTIHPERNWPLTCAALGRTDLVDDPQFADAEARATNHRALIDIFDEVFAGLTFDEWDARVHEHGLIACRVNALTDLATDEQVLANDYLVNLPHPDLGEWWHVPTPVEFEKTPVSVRTPAPHVGQHTRGDPRRARLHGTGDRRPQAREVV